MAQIPGFEHLLDPDSGLSQLISDKEGSEKGVISSIGCKGTTIYFLACA